MAQSKPLRAVRLVPPDYPEAAGTAWNILAGARAEARDLDGAIEAYGRGIGLAYAGGNLVGANLHLSASNVCVAPGATERGRGYLPLSHRARVALVSRGSPGHGMAALGNGGDRVRALSSGGSGSVFTQSYDDKAALVVYA